MTNPQPTRVIAELFENANLTLLEKTSSGLVAFQGVGAKGDIVNGNRRLYPTEVLKRAVQAVQSGLSEGNFTGELEHPETSAGSLDRTAIRYDKVWMDGDLMKFEGVILDVPVGKVLEGLLRGKVKVGMSTRGRGNLKYVSEEESSDNEPYFLVEDYQMLGLDAVRVPSNEAGMAKLKESIEGLDNTWYEEETMELTVEKLRKEHPALVSEIEQAAVAATQAKLDEATGQLTAKESTINDLKRQVQEAQAAAETKVAEKVAEFRSVLKTAGIITESEASDMEGDQLLESVRGERDSLKTELEETQTALRDAVHKIEAQALSVKLAEHFEKALEARKTEAGFLREHIDASAFASVEALDAEIERLAKLVESVRSKTTTPAGKGKQHLEESEEGDDEMARMRKLAGLG